MESWPPQSHLPRAEDVAGQAFAVDADEDRLVVRRSALPLGVAVADAALAQREVRLRIDGALVGVQRERAPVGRQRDALDALDELLALEAVADQVRDRAHLQVVLDGRTFRGRRGASSRRRRA